MFAFDAPYLAIEEKANKKYHKKIHMEKKLRIKEKLTLTFFAFDVSIKKPLSQMQEKKLSHVWRFGDLKRRLTSTLLR